jgi:site-specific DNA-methyltransferase (adenine-specific)
MSKLTITNEDNMLLMARYPDNYFDLAIVDPPYGIGISKNEVLGKGKYTKHIKKIWDNEIPTKQYFTELQRVSKQQIIWGGNYFTEFLIPTSAWIFWNKNQPESFNFTFSMGELAWTSFNKPLKKITIKKSETQNCVSNNKSVAMGNQKIHPTQKPIGLYKWLLDKYAKQGDKILDTHLGSGSIAIACHDYGFYLTACELDKEYFDKAIERIKNHTNQQKLF